jgi:hypothetical protein
MWLISTARMPASGAKAMAVSLRLKHTDYSPPAAPGKYLGRPGA